MVIFIHGASHSGKTVTAQKILEKYNIPYLSLDHLKMGLIRSGFTRLTPMDDDKLTDLLWPITREITKTAIENGQNLVIEGCYFPAGYKQDFSESYLKNIKYCAIVLSEDYIKTNFKSITAHACDIEKRVDNSLCASRLINENYRILCRCKENGNNFLLIDKGDVYNPETIRDQIYNL